MLPHDVVARVGWNRAVDDGVRHIGQLVGAEGTADALIAAVKGAPVMSLFGPHTGGMVIVHDVEIARARLQQALDTADPVEVAGLRRALEILAAVPASDDEVRTEWARTVLADARIDPKEQLKAIKALRAAKRGLSLKDAVEMAKRAAQ